MIKNYIKTAFRNLLKNKGFTAINVLGLALGLATCLLIVFFVFDELSFDKYNVNLERIYRLNNNIKFGGNEGVYSESPAPTAAAIKADFPEVEQVTRFRQRGGNLVKKGDHNIQEDMMVYADPTIFKVFTLPMIEGDPATALKETHSVVINEKTALKYFNTTSAIGKILTFNDTALYKVTGVIKNIPKQSHFDFDFFISMPSLNESKDDSWFSNNFDTYILFRPDANIDRFTAKLPEFVKKHAEPQLQSILHMNFATLEKGGNYFRFSVFPLKKIHLESTSRYDLGTKGDIKIVYIFSAIAIFILLIACVNFMNLSTARSSNRAKEVGVRKVLGSPRKYLIAQFLTESVMVTLAGAIIAMLLAWGFLHTFNQMSGKELAVTPQILGWLLPVMLLYYRRRMQLLARIPLYFFLVSSPSKYSKGKLASGFKGGMLRSSLVVFQFFISIVLIIGTVVIYNQLQYIQNKDVGYNRDHVMIINRTWTLGKKAKTFKMRIKQLAGVKNATMSGYLPTGGNNNNSSMFKDPVLDAKRAVQASIWTVDEDYIPTLGIKVKSGRNFSREMKTDTDAIIVNEAAEQLLGFKDPLNQLLYLPMDSKATIMKPFHIVGVIKNFNFKSLRESVTPLVLFDSEDTGALTVRMNSTDIPSLLAQMKSKWAGLSPNLQFDYSFMNENYEGNYRAEQRTGKIAVAFTSLAVIIACPGLFGLAAYAAEQRTKEIGIRKVLGASISTIVGMLSKDFIKLVLIAILVAAPVAWYFMNKWLEGFAYRQDFQWWVVILAGIGAILIAFVTISFQSIKAALTNPVKSLKSE